MADSAQRARDRPAIRRAAVAVLFAALVIAVAGCDPPSAYGPLQGQWTARPDAWPIAAKPAVGNGMVYIGSWHGYEYALNESSGAVGWRAYLGVTQADCDGTAYSQGVTSSPWLASGNAYLGGGDSNWYALNASTGTTLWTVPTGDNSPAGGHYNWASPAVYNGHAYVGIASFCDSPLVQGELLRVNLSTHQIENVWKAVPDGQVGATIWTSPVVDPARNLVFVTTGTRDFPTQQYAEALVALDATTLAVKGRWSLPVSDPTPDADWGTSPVLFADSAGNALVAAVNKNGILYAFNRDDLGAGPVWQTQIAAGGPCPTCGDGTVSTGIFDGQRLYFAGGRTTIDGHSYSGSVRAIDPRTGAFLWQVGLPAYVLGALAGANGMIAVPASNGNLYVISAATGTVLYGNGLTGAPNAPAIFGAPTIADSRLFIGTTDGVVHAFAFPSAVPAARGARIASVRTAAIHIQAGHCALNTGAHAQADCRIALVGRCAALGELPGAAGAVAIRRLSARASTRRGPATVAVRLFTNRTCAGNPARRLRLPGGEARLRFKPAWLLPPGTVISVAATRNVRLTIRVRGRTNPRIHASARFR